MLGRLKPNNFTVNISLVNSSNVKPEYFLGSLDISNTIKEFQRIFQWKFCDIFFSLFEIVTRSVTNGGVNNSAIFCSIHNRHNQNTFQDRLTFLKKHQILSIGLIEDFSRNSVNISDCHIYLFETVTCSRIKTIVILWYAQACRIRPLQIPNNFQNRLAIPNKQRIFSLGLKEAIHSNSLNRDFKMWYGEAVVWRQIVKITSGDV